MRTLTVLITLLAALLPVAGAAQAASDDEIYRDCVDGQIDNSYSNSDLDRAKDGIPDEIEEYSDCRGAIEQARIDNSAASGSPGAGTGGSSGAAGSGGGSGTTATGTGSGDGTSTTAADNAQPSDPQGPSEDAAVRDATRRGGEGVRLSPDTLVVPGATGIPANEQLRRSVPDPLLVALILVGAAALVGIVLGARARVITRRSR